MECYNCAVAPEKQGRRVPLKGLLQRLAWLEWTFLALLIAALTAKYVFTASAAEALLVFAAFVTGALVVFRWLLVGLKRVLWRLRYRLLLASLLLGIVPLAFVLVLVAVGAYFFTGQLAAYLITTEVEQRAHALLEPARGMARTPPRARLGQALWLVPYFRERFSGFEVVISDGRIWRYPENSSITPPPRGWGEASGLVRKGGALYLWAHAIHESADVTVLAPLNEDTLSALAPDLGELALVDAASGKRMARGGRVPPRANRFDIDVAWATPVLVANWESPGQFERDPLFLMTRSSAVLRTIFGQQVEWHEDLSVAFTIALLFSLLAGFLFVLELASLLFGVRLTRSITRAVHNLYQGTLRVREGDFSHRIEVRGKDQLAELSDSFNRMTENLERLVEVAKEKERLQSEIEIAREVQNQLFPKALPVSKTLRLAAACRPARLVSGDYYDYLNLLDSKIALAIGDVAGKGISAALLMATVQSTMRTQLRAGEPAATAGNGAISVTLSTAALVSRLNQQLFAFTPPEKFATFYFALYDDATGLLTYTNAGHPPPILLRKGQPSRLEVTGMVVGAFSSAQYEESTVALKPGDLLVCFTDGVTEPENEFGEMFGEERLTEIVVKNYGRDSEEIIAAVTESVGHWTGSPELQDDMTLLLARRI